MFWNEEGGNCGLVLPSDTLLADRPYVHLVFEADDRRASEMPGQTMRSRTPRMQQVGNEVMDLVHGINLDIGSS